MSFRPFCSRYCQTALVAVLCLGPGAVLRAADPVGTNAPAATNEVTTPVEKTFLQTIGSHFFKPNPALVKSPFNSMTALPAPAPLPRQSLPLNNRRDTLDPQKDWRFAPSDQIAEKFIAQEVLKLKDYDVDDNATGPAAELARFYQRLLRGDNETNRMHSVDADGRRTDGTSDEPNGPGTKSSASDGSVKDYFKSEGDTLHASSLGDLLGLSKPETPEDIRMRKEQQAQMESFRRLLGLPSPPAPAASGLSEPLTGPLSEPAESFSPRPAYSVPGTRPVIGASTPLNSSFAPSALGGLASQPGGSSPVASPSLAPVLAPSTPARSAPVSLNIAPGRRNF